MSSTIVVWSVKLIALASFSLNLFDGLVGAGNVTSAPLDPIPRVLVDPVFHAGSNTLDLIVSDFSLEDPLDVYLGPIGPLPVSTWHSTAPIDGLVPSSECPAVPLDDAAKASGMVMSTFPSSVQHVIVVVEMPEPENIVRAMQECVTEESPGNTGINHPQQEQRALTSWGEAGNDNLLGVGEFTIQEALRNAESAGDTNFTLSNLPLDDGEQIIIDPEAIAAGLVEPAVNPLVEGDNGSGLIDVQHVTELDPPPVTLSMPQPHNRERDMLPLPLLLVRRKDEVGFGTGRSVVAERLGLSEGFGFGKARWGESVIEIL